MKPNAPLEDPRDDEADPFVASRSRRGRASARTSPRVMDRTTVVRSVTHPYPIHGVAFATTGTPAIDVAMELSPTDPRHQPYIGSLVEYVLRRARVTRGPTRSTMSFCRFPFSSQRTDESHRAGPYAAYLGGGLPSEVDRVRRRGDESRRQGADRAFRFTAKSRISAARRQAISACRTRACCRACRSIASIAGGRCSQQFDAMRRDLEQSLAGKPLTRFQQTAFSMLTSPKIVRRARRSTRVARRRATCTA